jgi:pre-mRNA-splicing factor SYF1
MPRIWIDYCEFLLKYLPNRLTWTRQTFDRALRSLPVMQHERIWPLYLKFAKKAGGETAMRVFRRYIKVMG